MIDTGRERNQEKKRDPPGPGSRGVSCVEHQERSSVRRGSGSAADRAALGAKRFRRVPGPRLPLVGERLHRDADGG